MEIFEKINKILNDKKWTKNDIGMSRIQLGKLMLINGNLILLIKAHKNKPIWAMVEKIGCLKGGDLIIFFDGKYDVNLSKDEYEDYKEYIEKEEWNLLFEEDGIEKIINKGYVDEKGFYIDIQDNLRGLSENFEEADLTKIKEEISK